MKNMIKFICFLLLTVSTYANCDVAAYVWPAYHSDPRWREDLGLFSHGKGEWQNVYTSKPKFKGHKQPKVPLWGYEDESNPVVAARKIDAALAAGINVFFFDWYWYEGKPFLEAALNDGFLKAPNSERMKFCLMWANHGVNHTWDNTKAVKAKTPPFLNARISLDEFKKISKRIVEMYFKRKNYYKLDNKPLFCIFDWKNFINGVGGTEKAKEGISYLDKLCKDAGFDGVHVQLNQVAIEPKLPPIPNNPKPSFSEFCKFLNVSSATHYNWRMIVPIKGSGYAPIGTDGCEDMDYKKWGDESMSKLDYIQDRLGVPYFPVVTMGWDCNPRFPDGAYRAIASNNNPNDFERYLRIAKNWAEKNSRRLIIINAWNEYVEGAYLEPDSEFGYGFLNATARVFGGAGQSK